MTKPQEKEKSMLLTRPQWFLYIIETNKQQLYTGITTDWQRRFIEHSQNTKKSAKALRGKGPLVLKYCAHIGSHSCALKAEVWVKKQHKSDKLDIINGKLLPPFSHNNIDVTGEQ